MCGINVQQLKPGQKCEDLSPKSQVPKDRSLKQEQGLMLGQNISKEQCARDGMCFLCPVWHRRMHIFSETSLNSSPHTSTSRSTNSIKGIHGGSPGPPSPVPETNESTYSTQMVGSNWKPHRASRIPYPFIYALGEFSRRWTFQIEDVLLREMVSSKTIYSTGLQMTVRRPH